MPPPAPTAKNFHVLLVDDSPVEVLFLKDCLKSCAFSIRISQVDSAEKCLAFLRREGDYREAPAPDLVISDFNLPGMNGSELVEQIVADGRLSHLPILVISSWSRQEDIDHLYDLRCNAYILKPTSLEELERRIQVVCNYWFAVATLPTARGA